MNDSRVLCQSSGHEAHIQARDRSRCNGRIHIDEHLEPYAEAIGIERLVQARTVGAPQIEIKYAFELVGCGQRDEFAALLESTRLNNLVKQSGLQLRDDLREMRRIQNALNQRTSREIWYQRAIALLTPGLGH